MKLRIAFALFAFWFGAFSAWAAETTAPPLPGLTLPADIREDVSRRRYSAFDTAQFDYTQPGARENTHEKREGNVWRTALTIGANPKLDPDATMAQLAAAFERGGWSILRRQGTFVARKQSGAEMLWLSGTGNAGYFSITLLRAAPPARTLTLPPPASTPESLQDNKDFPYLPPFPGAVLEKTVHDKQPIEIVPPGGGPPSYAIPIATKWYIEPKDVSSYEFAAVYKQALTAAGWEVGRAAVAGDSVVMAHYAKNGRDIWLYTRADGSRQSISIADRGAETQPSALQRQLAQAGHVALYGIYFDTDIATPRPESETTLRQVADLLTQDPALKLEVQGHTDNTGTAARNETLSAARAASVREWLTGHGIDGGRLTSRGYAATKPVADNGTPQGRALNRRVELAKP